VPCDERGAACHPEREKRRARRRGERKRSGLDRSSRTTAVDGDDDARPAPELVHEARKGFPTAVAAVATDDAEAEQAA
jgi:hypothetical protein